MIFKRYERAQKWLREKNGITSENAAEPEDNEFPSMEELRAQANQDLKLDKSDWFALLFAALINIFIPCLLFLLFIVGVAVWLF